MLDLDYRNKQQQSYLILRLPDYAMLISIVEFSPRVLLPFETGRLAHSSSSGSIFSGGYALRTSNAQLMSHADYDVNADQKTGACYRGMNATDPATRLTMGAAMSG